MNPAGYHRNRAEILLETQELLQDEAIIKSSLIGYWLGALKHEWIMTFHILGISSSQVTNSVIFFRGVGFKPPTSYFLGKNTNLSWDYDKP